MMTMGYSVTANAHRKRTAARVAKCCTSNFIQLKWFDSD